MAKIKQSRNPSDQYYKLDSSAFNTKSDNGKGGIVSKLTKYSKNVVKSVTSLSFDLVGTYVPSLKDTAGSFKDAAKEAADEGKAAFDKASGFYKELKGKLSSGEDVSKKGFVQGTVKKVTGEMKDRLKSGKFYMSESQRMNEQMEKQMADEFGDFDDWGGDFGGGDDVAFESDNQSYAAIAEPDSLSDEPFGGVKKGRVTKKPIKRARPAGSKNARHSVGGPRMIINNVSDPKMGQLRLGDELIANSNAASAQSIITAQSNIFARQFAVDEGRYNKIIKVQTSILKGVNAISDYLVGVQGEAAKAQMEFQGKALAMQQDSLAMLKELKDAMVVTASYNEELFLKGAKNKTEDAVLQNGNINGSNYWKSVKKKTKDAIMMSPVGGMLMMAPMMGDMLADSKDMGMDMTPDFTSMITKGIANLFVSQKTKALAAKTDRLVKNFQSSFLGKMNNMATYGQTNFSRMLGMILGNQSDLKVNRFDDGLVDGGNQVVGWTAKSDRTLNKVIPYFLSKISVGVNGGEQERYNYSTGRIETVKSTESTYKLRSSQAYENTELDSFRERFIKTGMQVGKLRSKKSQQGATEAFRKIFDNLARSGKSLDINLMNPDNPHYKDYIEMLSGGDQKVKDWIPTFIDIYSRSNGEDRIRLNSVLMETSVSGKANEESLMTDLKNNGGDLYVQRDNVAKEIADLERILKNDPRYQMNNSMNEQERINVRGRVLQMRKRINELRLTNNIVESKAVAVKGFGDVGSSGSTGTAGIPNTLNNIFKLLVQGIAVYPQRGTPKHIGDLRKALKLTLDMDEKAAKQQAKAEAEYQQNMMNEMAEYRKQSYTRGAWLEYGSGSLWNLATSSFEGKREKSFLDRGLSKGIGLINVATNRLVNGSDQLGQGLEGEDAIVTAFKDTTRKTFMNAVKVKHSMVMQLHELEASGKGDSPKAKLLKKSIPEVEKKIKEFKKLHKQNINFEDPDISFGDLPGGISKLFDAVGDNAAKFTSDNLMWSERGSKMSEYRGFTKSDFTDAFDDIKNSKAGKYVSDKYASAKAAGSKVATAGLKVAYRGSKRAIKSVKLVASKSVFGVGGNVTRKFGQTYVMGKKKRHHDGIDISVNEGTVICAPFDAIVASVTPESNPDDILGICVTLIDSKTGNEWTYGHLSNVHSSVVVGTEIKKGKGFALSGGGRGDPGISTGPHVHIEVRDSEGNLIDPAKFDSKLRIASKTKSLLAKTRDKSGESIRKEKNTGGTLRTLEDYGLIAKSRAKEGIGYVTGAVSDFVQRGNTKRTMRKIQAENKVYVSGIQKLVEGIVDTGITTVEKTLGLGASGLKNLFNLTLKTGYGVTKGVITGAAKGTVGFARRLKYIKNGTFMYQSLMETALARGFIDAPNLKKKELYAYLTAIEGRVGDAIRATDDYKRLKAEVEGPSLLTKITTTVKRAVTAPIHFAKMMRHGTLRYRHLLGIIAASINPQYGNPNEVYSWDKETLWGYIKGLEKSNKKLYKAIIATKEYKRLKAESEGKGGNVFTDIRDDIKDQFTKVRQFFKFPKYRLLFESLRMNGIDTSAIKTLGDLFFAVTSLAASNSDLKAAIMSSKTFGTLKQECLSKGYVDQATLDTLGVNKFRTWQDDIAAAKERGKAFGRKAKEKVSEGVEAVKDFADRSGATAKAEEIKDKIMSNEKVQGAVDAAAGVINKGKGVIVGFKPTKVTDVSSGKFSESNIIKKAKTSVSAAMIAGQAKSTQLLGSILQVLGGNDKGEVDEQNTETIAGLVKQGSLGGDGKDGKGGGGFWKNLLKGAGLPLAAAGLGIFGLIRNWRNSKKLKNTEGTSAMIENIISPNNSSFNVDGSEKNALDRGMDGLASSRGVQIAATGLKAGITTMKHNAANMAKTGQKIASSKAGEVVAKAITESGDGLLSKFGKKVVEFVKLTFTKIKGNALVKRFLGSGVKKLGGFVSKITGWISSKLPAAMKTAMGGIKATGAKVAAKAVPILSIAVGLFDIIKSFADGWNNAGRYFKVFNKDLTTGMKVTSMMYEGLKSVLVNALMMVAANSPGFQGLAIGVALADIVFSAIFPPATVVPWIYKMFAGNEAKEELEKKQAELKSHADAMGVSSTALAEVDNPSTMQKLTDRNKTPDQINARNTRILGEAGAKAYQDLDKNINAQAPKAFGINGRISSFYGNRINPVDPSKGMQFHEGIDIAVASGTRLLAPEDGIIKAVRDPYSNPDPLYGGCVLLQGNSGFSYLFGHMKQVDVAAGQNVRKGEFLGLSGGADADIGKGTSKGAHVHLTTLDSQMNFIDPLTFMQPDEKGADLAQPNNKVKANTRAAYQRLFKDPNGEGASGNANVKYNANLIGESNQNRVPSEVANKLKTQANAGAGDYVIPMKAQAKVKENPYVTNDKEFVKIINKANAQLERMYKEQQRHNGISESFFKSALEFFGFMMASSGKGNTQKKIRSDQILNEFDKILAENSSRLAYGTA